MGQTNQVSKSIKDLRKEKNLTQDQLAEALHVTRQAVSNWENGKTEPDVETLSQLAAFFGVDIERIIYGKSKNSRNISINIGPQKAAESGVGLGTIIAVVISYAKWKSIGWAIFHGLLNWAYVIYYVIKY